MNDENMFVLQGDTRVADISLTELNGLRSEVLRFWQGVFLQPTKRGSSLAKDDLEPSS
jgi:hypothetical protein